MREWVSSSPEETVEIAREIASLLPEGAIVQLTGGLGAGKTTLTKSLVEAWGDEVAENVTSPTFTLIHEYGEPVRVYHIDLYRLESDSEFFGLGLDEIFDSGARVLVEWGEKFGPLLPPQRYVIEIRSEGEWERRIRLTDPVASVLD